MKLFTRECFLKTVNEGLIKTESFETLMSQLEYWTHDIPDENKSVNFIGDKLHLNFYNIILDSGNLQQINSIIYRLGYYPSYYYYKYGYNLTSTGIYDLNKVSDLLDNTKMQYLTLTIEGKFANEVTEIPTKLYHITDIQKKEKILIVGLKPSSGIKISFHPDRIYLAEDPDGLIKTFTEVKKYFKNWVIFEVDTSKLKNRWFKDPNYKPDGYFTYQNIHPKFLKVFKELKYGES